jgi:uncharacterized membrane protein (UPF0127 family)
MIFRTRKANTGAKKWMKNFHHQINIVCVRQADGVQHQVSCLSTHYDSAVQKGEGQPVTR